MNGATGETAVRHTFQILGWAGLLPFVYGAAGIWFGGLFLPLDPLLVFICYSATILSFLAGSLWGMAIAGPTRPFTLLFTNACAVLAWAALLLAHPAVSLMGLMLAYGAIWVFEWKIFPDRATTYIVMRHRLSALVVALHLVMLIGLAVEA